MIYIVICAKLYGSTEIIIIISVITTIFMVAAWLTGVRSFSSNFIVVIQVDGTRLGFRKRAKSDVIRSQAQFVSDSIERYFAPSLQLPEDDESLHLVSKVVQIPAQVFPAFEKRIPRGAVAIE